MRFATPLLPATLIRRYKRFLADIRLEDGREVTAHCPNPGAMQGLATEGMRIWVEPNDDPKKKLKYGWRLVELPGGGLAGIDTGLANRIIAEALAARTIPALAAYPTIRSEVPYGTQSRVDFLLQGADLPDLYLEIKSVTLRRSGSLAEFPDSVTARGAKHLAELAQMKDQGHRAALLYLVQRTDCTAMTLAADLDPTYARAMKTAMAAGVEVFCFDAQIHPEGLSLGASLPLDFSLEKHT